MGDDLEKQVQANMHRAVDEMLTSLASMSNEDGAVLDQETRRFRQQKQVLVQAATVEYLLSQLAKLPKNDAVKNTDEAQSAGSVVDLAFASFPKTAALLESKCKASEELALTLGGETVNLANGNSVKSVMQVKGDEAIGKVNLPDTNKSKSDEDGAKRKVLKSISKKPPSLDFECNVCLKLFSSIEKLSRHYLIHTRPFRCTVCGVTCAEKFKLRRHCSRKHGNSELVEDTRKSAYEYPNNRVASTIAENKETKVGVETPKPETLVKDGKDKGKVRMKRKHPFPLVTSQVTGQMESGRVRGTVVSPESGEGGGSAQEVKSGEPEVSAHQMNSRDVGETTQKENSGGREIAGEQINPGDAEGTEEEMAEDATKLAGEEETPCEDPSVAAGGDLIEACRDSGDIILSLKDEIMETDGIFQCMEMDENGFYIDVNVGSNETIFNSVPDPPTSPHEEFQDSVPLENMLLDRFRPPLYVLHPLNMEDDDNALAEKNRPSH